MNTPSSTPPGGINATVLQPAVPLVVLERCPSAQHITVWLALRWLKALFPERQGFNSREIAAVARVNRKYVAGKRKDKRSADGTQPGWLEDLARLGLLVPAGEITLPGCNPLKLYDIPLAALEQESAAIAATVLARWGAPQPAPQGPADPPADRLPDPLGQCAAPATPLEDRESDPLGDTLPDPLEGRRKDRRIMEGGREASTHANEMEDRAAPPQRTPIADTYTSISSPALPAPPDEIFLEHQQWQPGAVPSHPLDLWRKACPIARPIDNEHLKALALEHNATSGGYGWYWVGRAILAASLNENINSVAKIRRVMMRWRDEDSYGSDAPGTGRARAGRTYDGAAAHGRDDDDRYADEHRSSRRNSSRKPTLSERLGLDNVFTFY